MKISLEELKGRLQQKSAAGEPIIFRRVTQHLVASPRELAAADLLLIDHTSSTPNRNPVAELLPLADANHELLKNAEIFQEIMREYNVIAGVCGSDPFRLPEKLLEQIKALGFVGVQNTPSIGMIDGTFRDHLENSHISYTQEVTMLAMAKKLGLLAVGTVFLKEHAIQMKDIGIDVLVSHPGPKALLRGGGRAESGGSRLGTNTNAIAGIARDIVLLGLPT